MFFYVVYCYGEDGYDVCMFVYIVVVGDVFGKVVDVYYFWILCIGVSFFGGICVYWIVMYNDIVIYYSLLKLKVDNWELKNIVVGEWS